jgi:hypothetical protein
MRNDLSSELGELSALGIVGFQGESNDRVNLAGEVFIGKEEFSDEIASLTIDRRDTNVSRHLNDESIEGMVRANNG